MARCLFCLLVNTFVVTIRGEPRRVSQAGLRGTVIFEDLDESFDAMVGQGHDLTVVGSINPDHAVFGIHAESKFMKQFDVFAEIVGSVRACGGNSLTAAV